MQPSAMATHDLHAYIRLPNVPTRRHVMVPRDALVSDLSTALGLTRGRICTDAGKYLSPDVPLAAAAAAAGLGGPSVFLSVMGGLCGGKGGFGSMLRAQGGRMSSKKPTNTDMCRDLSGRRLKTIKEAKKITDALEKVAELEAKREAKVTKKIEQGLKALDAANSKKRRFDDETYEREHQELMESVRESTKLALKAAASGSSSSSSSGSGSSRKKAKLAEPAAATATASVAIASATVPGKGKGKGKSSGGLSYWDALDSDESDSDVSDVEAASSAAGPSSASAAKLVTA